MSFILEFLAFPMTPIIPYSPTHLLIAAVTLAGALCLAKLVRRKNRVHVIFSCGLILVFMEIIKQLLLTYVRGGSYSWSDFPFQLCSVPMYLCLLYPFWKKGRREIEKFLMSFGLLGSIAAFAVPYSSFTSVLVLTAQSVLWHGILFFLAVYVMLCGPLTETSGDIKEAAADVRSFKGAAFIYLFCAAVAVILNMAFYRVSAGSANMFFFGPGWPDMLVLNDIYEKAGWIPETMVMAAGTELAGWVVHVFYILVRLRRE